MRRCGSCARRGTSAALVDRCDRVRRRVRRGRRRSTTSTPRSSDALVEAAARARRGAVRRARLARGGRAHRRAACARQAERVDGRADVVPALSFLDLAWARLGVDPVAERRARRRRPPVRDRGRGRARAAAGGPVRQPRRAVGHEALRSISTAPPVVGAAAARPARRARSSRSRGPTSTAPSSPTTSRRCSSMLVAPPVASRGGAVRRARARAAAAVPVGPRADPPVAHPPPARGDLRGARGDRSGSTPRPARATTHLEEELGDLLFQICFHATLAGENGAFTLADVARTVHDKLVVRHPHVFGDADADRPTR